MPRQDVLDTFVGRTDLLKQLITHLRAQKGSDKPKHIFLHGPRGIGKTTMLLVLRYKVEADKGLDSAFDIVQFSEEERRVTNLPAFAVRILEFLSNIIPGATADLEKARANPEHAFKILLDVANQRKDRKVLLLLDNFDDLAAAITRGRSNRFDAAKLRPRQALKKLLACPSFVVVATALRDPQKRKDFPRKELLPCFDPIVPLTPLDNPMDFLSKRAKKDRREGFLKNLPRLASRIEGLNRLADGNPRLLVFLYDCLGQAPLLDLVEIVQRTVDDLTPMYQDVIDRLLNPGQAAVLDALAANGGVGRAKEIASFIFQNETTTRTFLGDLCNLGLITRAEAIKTFFQVEEKAEREATYRTCPPLFQIWYEMRHLNSDESLYLVHFFSLLTEPQEVRLALQELRVSPITQEIAPVVRLIEDVVHLLDPEWETIKEEYIDKTLASGGNYHDALTRLKTAITEQGNTLSSRRIGLLVVRSEINYSIGNTEAAQEDVAAAEACLTQGAQPELRCKLLLARSLQLDKMGEPKRALEQAELAITLCASLSEPSRSSLEIEALLTMASAYESTGQYNRAIQSLDCAQEQMNSGTGDRTKARVASLLGIIHRSLGDYDRARDYHEKSLAIKQQIGDRSGEASSLNSLGIVCQSLGDYDRARDYYEKSLAIQQQIGDRAGEAKSLGNLGTVCLSLGDYDRARDYYEKSLAIKQQIGNRAGEASSLNNLGNVCQSLGDYDCARDYYEESLTIEQQIGDRSGEASTFGALGTLARSEGKLESALDHFQKSQKIFQSLGERPLVSKSAHGVFRLLIQLAEKALASTDMVQADRHVTQALSMSIEVEPQRALTTFVSDLLVPCMQRSREMAPQVLSWLEQIENRPLFAHETSSLRTIAAVVRFYTSGSSALANLGSSEVFLARSIIDRIERPDHVRAQELLKSGQRAGARDAYNHILEKSPHDIEASLNLSQIHIADGEFNKAETQVKAVLQQKPDLAPALFIEAQIAQKLGQWDKAINGFQRVLEVDPTQKEAYSALAQILRSRKRFSELTGVLKKWRNNVEETEMQERLDVWIPESILLSGDLMQAKGAMPQDSLAPKASDAFLLLELLRTFFALRDKDGDLARRHALAALGYAGDLPPREVPGVLSQELIEQAQNTLGKTEFNFFVGLGLALSQRIDPVQFANEFLTDDEVQELAQRVTEDGHTAMDALHAGRIQTLRDLFRISTRSTGPAAGITALGDAYGELSRAQRGVIFSVFVEAVKQGGPGEVAAALGAMGKNLLDMQPDERMQCLDTILDLCSNSKTISTDKERALGILNISYPNLDKKEQQKIQDSLKKLQGEIETPGLVEFFNETLPQVEREKNI